MGDNEEGVLITACVLERTLAVLFGHKTVPVRMFRGKGCRDPRIPASFFATDRLKNHPNKPINRPADYYAFRVAPVSRFPYHSAA